jgi:two-component system response regulator MprA
MAKLLLIEDDALLRVTTLDLLQIEDFEVIVAGTGAEGLRLACEHQPDLIISDIVMPEMDGYQVLNALRQEPLTSHIPFVFITAKAEKTDIIYGREAGADDYLVKPAQLSELLARVRALLRRRNPEQNEVLRFVDMELDTGTRVAHRGQREIELSTTEYELLQLFMRRPRQVLTRDIIMERVWGYDFGGASNVLEVYVGYLRAKMEADGEPRLLHTVRGAGYVLREKSESDQAKS